MPDKKPVPDAREVCSRYPDLEVKPLLSGDSPNAWGWTHRHVAAFGGPGVASRPCNGPTYVENVREVPGAWEGSAPDLSLNLESCDHGEPLSGSCRACDALLGAVGGDAATAALREALGWCQQDAENEDGHPTQEMLDARVSVLQAALRPGTPAAQPDPAPAAPEGEPEGKAAHTPGPWHTEQSNSGGWAIIAPSCGGPIMYGHTTAANATLLAAAPDLLAALKRLLRRLDNGDSIEPGWHEAEAARSIIKSAKLGA